MNARSLSLLAAFFLFLVASSTTGLAGPQQPSQFCPVPLQGSLPDCQCDFACPGKSFSGVVPADSCLAGFNYCCSGATTAFYSCV